MAGSDARSDDRRHADAQGHGRGERREDSDRIAPAPRRRARPRASTSISRRANGNALPVRIIHRTGYDGEGAAAAVALPGAGSRKAARRGRWRPTRSRLARFFNSVPMGIAELDGEGIIRNANLAFMSLSPQARRGGALESRRSAESQRRPDTRCARRGAGAGEGRATSMSRCSASRRARSSSSFRRLGDER